MSTAFYVHVRLEVNNPESTKETIKSLLQAESPQGLFDLICVLLEQLSEVHPKKVLLDDFKRSLPERKITSSSSTGKVSIIPAIKAVV